jgi:hypothetical protein
MRYIFKTCSVDAYRVKEPLRLLRLLPGAPQPPEHLQFVQGMHNKQNYRKQATYDSNVMFQTVVCLFRQARCGESHQRYVRVDINLFGDSLSV